MTYKTPFYNENFERLMQKGIEKDDVIKYYNKWAETYEEDHEKLKYTLHDKNARKTTELFPVEARSRVRILDVGAGTGMLGSALREAGFTSIDGLDPAKDMLDKSQKRGIYDNCLVEMFTEKQLDIKEGTYDAVVGNNIFGNNLVQYKAIIEMIRLIKKGGYVVLTFRSAILDYEEHAGMLRWLEQMEEDEKISILCRNVISGFFKDVTGVLLVLKKW